MARNEQDPPPIRDGLVLGAHWGFLTFFAGLGGYYLLSLILTAVAVGGEGEVGSLRIPELGPLVLLAFVPNLLLGLAPVFGARRWGRGVLAEYRLLPNSRDLVVGLACGGFALLTGYVLNVLLLEVYGTERMSDPLTEVFGGIATDTGWLVVAALIVVVCAPLTEELFVRGALWNGLAHYRVPPWVILLLTALVFAQLHGEPSRTIALLGQGIVIGYARLITDRVGASVVAHATNNLPPALLLFGS
ncbi:CPBP family intramembrane glutamic endopeptidase [Prauserella cavernicola]|uniref:CPBP family intramembrane metalloprotease n=1 Tax=Prauserella cavernicola TaxID=2800127 RepID=A0A934QWV3_9PSEU|nr:type II CAAX endopeptidase family protein [Prauserella cavernicola]MBK1786773.1 CPBP family intramembrane metalloprotease [Prauserella cavernicola]